MKTLFTVSCIFVLGFMAKAQTTFDRRYELTAASAFILGGSFIASEEQGYIALVSDFGPDLNNKPAVIKFDSLGNILWSKALNNYDPSNFTSLASSPDSGVVVLMNRYDSFTGYLYVMLSKFDRNGNLLWTKRYHETNKLSVGASVIAVNNEYVFVGTSYDSLLTNYETILVKTDLNGNIISSTSYQADFSPTDIIPDPAGNFIIAGRNGNSDLGFMKTDSGGNLLWTNIYSGSYPAEILSLTLNNLGGIVATGRTVDAGGQYEIFLFTVDSSGNFMWGKTYGTFLDEEGYTVHQTRDHGYIITAEPESYLGVPQTAFIKTDSSGNLLWTKIIRLKQPDGTFPYGSIQHADGSLTVLCIDDFDFSSVTMIRTDSAYGTNCTEMMLTLNMGSFTWSSSPVSVTASSFSGEYSISMSDSVLVVNTATLCDLNYIRETGNQYAVQITPNPVTGISILEILSPNPLENAQVVITDAAGRVVETNSDIKSNTVAIDGTRMTAGIYFYTVYEGDRTVSTGKFIVE